MIVLTRVEVEKEDRQDRKRGLGEVLLWVMLGYKDIF